MNLDSRASWKRWAHQADALTYAAVSECLTPRVRWALRPVAWWWSLQRWWLFHVAWSRPVVACTRWKRDRIDTHREFGLIPCWAADAINRASRQTLRHRVEERIKAGPAPWRWDGAQPPNKEAGDVRAGAR